MADLGAQTLAFLFGDDAEGIGRITEEEKEVKKNTLCYTEPWHFNADVKEEDRAVYIMRKGRRMYCTREYQQEIYRRQIKENRNALRTQRRLLRRGMQDWIHALEKIHTLVKKHENSDAIADHDEEEDEKLEFMAWVQQDVAFYPERAAETENTETRFRHAWQHWSLQKWKTFWQETDQLVGMAQNWLNRRLRTRTKEHRRQRERREKHDKEKEERQRKRLQQETDDQKELNELNLQISRLEASKQIWMIMLEWLKQEQNIHIYRARQEQLQTLTQQLDQEKANVASETLTLKEKRKLQELQSSTKTLQQTLTDFQSELKEHSPTEQHLHHLQVALQKLNQQAAVEASIKRGQQWFSFNLSTAEAMSWERFMESRDLTSDDEIRVAKLLQRQQDWDIQHTPSLQWFSIPLSIMKQQLRWNAELQRYRWTREQIRNSIPDQLVEQWRKTSPATRDLRYTKDTFDELVVDALHNKYDFGGRCSQLDKYVDDANKPGWRTKPAVYQSHESHLQNLRSLSLSVNDERGKRVLLWTDLVYDLYAGFTLRLRESNPLKFKLWVVNMRNLEKLTPTQQLDWPDDMDVATAPYPPPPWFHLRDLSKIETDEEPERLTSQKKKRGTDDPMKPNSMKKTRLTDDELSQAWHDIERQIYPFVISSHIASGSDTAVYRACNVWLRSCAFVVGLQFPGAKRESHVREQFDRMRLLDMRFRISDRVQQALERFYGPRTVNLQAQSPTDSDLFTPWLPVISQKLFTTQHGHDVGVSITARYTKTAQQLFLDQFTEWNSKKLDYRFRGDTGHPEYVPALADMRTLLSISANKDLLVDVKNRKHPYDEYWLRMTPIIITEQQWRKLLRLVAFMDECHLIHGDLKLDNIGWDEIGDDFRLADLGRSAFIEDIDYLKHDEKNHRKVQKTTMLMGYNQWPIVGMSQKTRYRLQGDPLDPKNDDEDMAEPTQVTNKARQVYNRVQFLHALSMQYVVLIARDGYTTETADPKRLYPPNTLERLPCMQWVNKTEFTRLVHPSYLTWEEWSCFGRSSPTETMPLTIGDQTFNVYNDVVFQEAMVWDAITRQSIVNAIFRKVEFVSTQHFIRLPEPNRSASAPSMPPAPQQPQQQQQQTQPSQQNSLPRSSMRAQHM